MQRSLLLGIVLGLATGCGEAGDSDEIEPHGASKLTVIEGEPSARNIAPRAGVTLGEAPAELELIGGVIAVGTGSGVFASDLGADELTEIAVHPDQDGPKSTGAVRALTRRTGDGLLVVADNGLFHTASGYLLSSPFGESVDPSTITALSARGVDAEEELWLVTNAGSYWVSRGAITKFSLKGVTIPVSLAIGTDAGQAVLVAGENAYHIDLNQRRASLVASDLGSVQGGDAAEDGTVALATSVGVLMRSRSGDVTLRTLSPEGEPGKRVLSIASAFGSVVLLTETGVVTIQTGQATTVGEEAAKSGSLAVDASGDAWSIEDGALYRYETGKPVSFANEVAPFFKAHCDSCHLPSAPGTAPDHEFAKYEVATEWADTIERRLQATDATTMPPPNSEVLTSNDYAIVLRWVKGGLLP